MIPCGTPYCSSDSWMYSKVQISSATLLFLLVTVHQGTCASLKGQKAVFQLNAPDEYGTLSPGANIPSLGSFTLCIDIRLRQNNKNGMVAFTYNTDMKRARSVPHHELGIMIKNRKPIIWLFHKQIDVEKDISLGNWHTVCLTWDGNTREAHVYLNKIHVLSRTLNSAYNLAQNGSLVLGRKHSRRADRLRLDRKIFVGDLYLFRLWDHAKGHQSILQLDCEDGNVITWDSRQWDFVGSILKYDPSLPCSKTVLKSRFKRSGSSTDCDKSEECGKSEGGTQTGTTSSKVTLRPSSTKETSTTPTGISSPPNTTEVSTTPPEISNPPNTTEVNPTPTEISSPPNATEISTTPSEISPPPNTTEINTSRTGTLPRPNRTESSTILTGTSPQPNRTENTTTVTGISPEMNRTGNSFTKAAISPMTENTTTLTVTSSPPNTTENRMTVNGTSSPPNTTGNSFTNATISPETVNSSTVAGSSPPWDRTENRMTVNGTSSPPNTTGNSFTNATISPETVNSSTVAGSSPPWDRTENRMTLNGTSSPLNTTGDSFTNATISPVTVNSSTVTGSSPPWDRTENTTTLTGTSSPPNTTENTTTLTGTSSPPNTTGNYFTNAAISPMTVNSSTVTGSSTSQDRTGTENGLFVTKNVRSLLIKFEPEAQENSTTLTGTLSPQNTTGNSFTNATISPMTVNSSTVTSLSPPWDRTGNFISDMTTSPETVNMTITGTSSPQNTTGYSFTNMTISFGTGNPVINKTSSSGTGDSMLTNGTSSPQITTVNITTDTETSLPQITTVNNSPADGTSTTQNTTVYTTPSPQNTTASTMTTNETLSTQKITGNSVTNIRIQPRTGMTTTTNRTSPSQIIPVNSTIIMMTPPLQNTTVNGTVTSPSQNTTVNSTIITMTPPLQNTTVNGTVTSPPQNTTVNSTIITMTPPLQNTTVNGTVTSPPQNTTVNSTIITMTPPLQNTTVNSTIITMTPPLQNTTVNGTVTSPPQNITVNSTIITMTLPLQNTTVNGTETSPPQNTTENPLMISPTDASAVALIVSQLEKILQRESINEGLAVTLINTISNLINASLDAVASSSRQILNIVDRIGEKLQFSTESINITSPFLALAVNKINATAFGGADFSISNITNLQDSLDEGSPQAGFAMIELPSSLFKNLSLEELDSVSRIQFSFHEKPTLFQDSNITNTSMLNSHIIASSVNANISISDLADPVKITFKNLQLAQDNLTVECVFWDFRKNNGSGGWNSQGCTTAQITSNQTVCECNHLTHFGVLLAISREPITDRVQQRILSFITYIGCGLSSICLAMTLVTYLIFEKLRRDYPSKILINLCTALLFLNMVFLIDSWIAVYDIEGLCIAVAALLHYFLLASFTWMSLEALHMYLALVKVFNTYVRKYILKFCILGWGIPIVVVAIILGTGANGQHNYGSGAYGRDANTTLDEFCWINNDTTFYVAAVGYFCIMFLVNLSMFIVVLTQLCQIKSKKHHRNAQKSVFRDMRSVAGLTFLLGITWGFAFFAWGPVNLPFMYLFAIFNTLQGTFIFIFHCAIKENVQKEWRRHLCCGKLTLPEYSDWSITATNNTKKLQPLVQGMSLSSTSNNSLQSTSPLYPARDYSCHPNVNGARL